MRSKPAGRVGREHGRLRVEAERAADERADAVRQRAQGRADAAVDVEPDEPDARRELLPLGQARSGPAEDRQLMAVARQRRRRSQESRIVLEDVGRDDRHAHGRTRQGIDDSFDEGSEPTPTRPDRQRSVRLGQSPVRRADAPPGGPARAAPSQRSRRTTMRASAMIRRDILLSPTWRSVNTMGTSATRAPARLAR